MFEKSGLKRALGIFLALAALTLPATIPLWQVDFIFTADSPLHLWRVYELDRALRQGIFYPRWASDLYFGYGYPLFNFYPPLAYYLVQTFHVIGLDIANAIKLEFGVGIFLAACGMFLLARDFYSVALLENWQRDAAAFVSAAAYVYAPYFLLDIYTRGAVAEVLGMALLPFYVWSLRRAIAHPTAARALAAGIIGAVFLTAHNLTAFFSAPALAGFVLVKLFFAPQRARIVSMLALSLGLTLALSAFYWLPATTELGWVFVGQSERRHAELLRTMTEHFQSVASVVQARWFYEYPEGPFPLALGSLLIALGGFIAAMFMLKKMERVELAYWFVVALVAAFLLTDAARELWFAFPSLWVIQFAWRLTVLITLATALASGGWMLAAQNIPARFRAPAFAALLLILNLVAVGMWNLRAQAWQTQMPAASEFQTLARFEANVRAGLGSMDEYLPQWTRVVPQPLVTERAENLAPLPTFHPEIKIVSITPTEWNIETNSPDDFVLRWRAFYYPDYYAWIDHQSAALRPGTGLGLLTLDVPSGQHQIRLQHASLPTRDAAWGLTAFALLSLGAWSIFQIRRGARDWQLPIAVVSVVLLVFLIPHTRLLAANASAYTTTRVEVDDSLRAVAFHIEQPTNDKIKLNIVWHVKQTPERETPFKARLIDAQGRVWSARNMWARYGTGAIREWFPNQLVQDGYDIFLPSELPRGEYQLQLARAKSEWTTLTTLTLQGGGGNARAAPTISHAFDAQFDETIRLLGWDAPTLTSARPNDAIPITLFWRAEKDVLEDYSVFVQVIDQHGTLVAQRDSLPNNGFTPTMLWAPGEIVADHHVLALPPTLSPGEYKIIAGLYRFQDLSRLPVSNSQGASDEDYVILANLKIPADDISFQPAQRAQFQFGDAMQLRGFTLNAQDTNGNILARAENSLPARMKTLARGTLTLTLEWSALRAPQNDYTVFVHLVDANGIVARQQDNPPVHGNYPTTLWEPNERVVDTYALSLENLSAGEYTLRVGMYESNGGERLPVFADGGAELPNREIDLARVTITP